MKRLALCLLLASPALADYRLDIPAGRLNFYGIETVNKFGRAPEGVQTSATDVWDRADATPTQQIWVAPTTARVHNFASSSASDDGDPAGVGARTLRFYGLTSWTTPEVSEVIELNGAGDVATQQAYVCIHRAKVLTKGGTNVNVGTITATAVTDGTITAAILPGAGQTQMAIYCVPEGYSAFVSYYYVALNETAATSLDAALLVNPEPDAELTNFLTKHTVSAKDTGSTYVRHDFNPYFRVDGPAIIKVQGISSAADTDVDGGFGLYLAPPAYVDP